MFIGGSRNWRTFTPVGSEVPDEQIRDMVLEI